MIIHCAKLSYICLRVLQVMVLVIIMGVTGFLSWIAYEPRSIPQLNTYIEQAIWEASGKNYKELLAQLIELAIKRNQEEQRLLTSLE